ncbi:neurogenic locus notch homolog protein 1-like [Dendronephthya gigantea]|uniref:neurogenic locus notch homolog protein 1-like n=1 Tax=Dendronephthya gigantea TaxID=151771 RepID=UPI0010697703|nr:neurogenic locus notch homolog protein 1-like [Dendronephthya gigantea]
MALAFRPMFVLCLGILSIVAVNGSSVPCPCKVKYTKVGCYKDPGSYTRISSERHFPDLLLNWRDRIDWYDGWHDFLKALTCRCAELAKERGYRYYGLQFFGECWSGEHSEEIFETKKAKSCWGYRPNYTQCVDDSPNECVGKEHHNYIYEVMPEVPEGCIGGGAASTTEKPVVDPCYPNPCQNGGECYTLENSNDYVCECPDEYRGPHCEIPRGKK